MFIKLIKSLFSTEDNKKSKDTNDTPESKRVYDDSCRHCHGTGDVMLTNLDGSVTGQAFGECGCWKG